MPEIDLLKGCESACPLNWGQKGTTKKLCDKDFAELSFELSGAICLKNPSFLRCARPLLTGDFARKDFGQVGVVSGSAFLWFNITHDF